MDKDLKVEISFRDEAPEEVMSVLKEVGADKVKPVDEHGILEGALVYVGVLVASSLANLVIKLLPLWKCGVIVDARASTILTQKNCDLPRGTVLVINPDGTRSTLERPSELDLKSLIGKMALGKS